MFSFTNFNLTVGTQGVGAHPLKSSRNAEDVRQENDRVRYMWRKQMVPRVEDVRERELIEEILRCEKIPSKSSTERSSVLMR